MKRSDLIARLPVLVAVVLGVFAVIAICIALLTAQSAAAQYACVSGSYSGPYAPNFVSHGEVVENQNGSDPYCWVETVDGNDRWQIKASEVEGYLAYEGFVVQSVEVTEQVSLRYEAQGNPYSSVYADVEGFNVWWLRSYPSDLETPLQFEGIGADSEYFWSWDISAIGGVWSFSLYVIDLDGTTWRVQPGQVAFVQVKCIEFIFEGNLYFDAFTTSGEASFDHVGNIVCNTTSGSEVMFREVGMWHDFTQMGVSFDFEIPVSVDHVMYLQHGWCQKQGTDCVRQSISAGPRVVPIEVTPFMGIIAPTWQAYHGELITPTALPILLVDEDISLVVAPALDGDEVISTIARIVYAVVGTME